MADGLGGAVVEIACQFFACILFHGHQPVFLFHQVLVEVGILDRHHGLVADSDE